AIGVFLQLDSRSLQSAMQAREDYCKYVSSDTPRLGLARQVPPGVSCRITLRLSRCRKRERSGRWRQSAAAECSAPTSTLPVNTLCGHRLLLLHIEAIVVDRPSTRSWSWVLYDQDLSPSLGMELIFIVRIGMEDHCARPVLAAANPKGSLEDIPDLREIVVVQRMMRTRLKAQNTRVRVGRPLGTRMKDHLARLSGAANHFPSQLVAV